MKKTNVRLHTYTGKPEVVPAERLVGKVWAIHRSLDGEWGPPWTLTHRPTGRLALRSYSRAALTEAASLLPGDWLSRAKFGGGERSEKPAGLAAAQALLATDGGGE